MSPQFKKALEDEMLREAKAYCAERNIQITSVRLIELTLKATEYVIDGQDYNLLGLAMDSSIDTIFQDCCTNVEWPED